MEEKLKKLEKQVKILTGLCMILMVGVVLAIIANPSRIDDVGVLRVKGIVVEDSVGKGKVVIGAPDYRIILMDSVSYRLIEVKPEN